MSKENQFIDHLNAASLEVATWPEWKQKLMGISYARHNKCTAEEFEEQNKQISRDMEIYCKGRDAGLKEMAYEFSRLRQVNAELVDALKAVANGIIPGYKLCCPICYRAIKDPHKLESRIDAMECAE
jgi:hypothetical protein